jgi:hypothetical protein
MFSNAAIHECANSLSFSVYSAGKYKFVPVLCNKTYVGNVGIVPTLLTSALDESEWSASRPVLFSPDNYWIGGWVGPRASLGEEKNLAMHAIELGSSSS